MPGTELEVLFGVSTTGGSTDLNSVDFDNFLVTTGEGLLPDVPIPADSIFYDSPTRTVTLSYLTGPLGVGNYVFLASPETSTGIRDAGGVLLDGEPIAPLPSGDGIPGAWKSYAFQRARNEPTSLASCASARRSPASSSSSAPNQSMDGGIVVAG